MARAADTALTKSCRYQGWSRCALPFSLRASLGIDKEPERESYRVASRSGAERSEDKRRAGGQEGEGGYAPLTRDSGASAASRAERDAFNGPDGYDIENAIRISTDWIRKRKYFFEGA